jgi:hypothetical protein
MKYSEKKSSRTEYKQKRNIGKEIDCVYADPVQRRARWKLVAVGSQKKLGNGRRATKLAQRRSTETAKNPKNIEIDRKAIHQNTKTNTRKPSKYREI